MEVLGGMVVLAFLLFIASKLGYVTIKFHKPANKPTAGSGGKIDDPVKKVRR